MPSHVALLRGINVGGRNKVPMRDLRAAFESDGFTGVSTYIQSGNVLFDAPADDPVEPRIQALLTEQLGLDLVVGGEDAYGTLIGSPGDRIASCSLPTELRHRDRTVEEILRDVAKPLQR